MKTLVEKKRGPAAIFALCPVRHALTALFAAVIALHVLLRGNRRLMVALSERFVRPLHRALALVNSHVPFSAAEALIALAVVSVLGYLCVQMVLLICRDGRAARLYRTAVTLLCAGLGVYALFCLCWGVYYYADDFAVKSGFDSGAVSVEQLESVTRYFAALTNEYSSQVKRDDAGVCRSDRERILEKSKTLFEKTVGEYPFLDGPEVRAKGVVCSRVMSYIDFTGFFFPFTGEANVNIESPECDFAATVAHELSHQRGVAKEQEANFVAVLASLRDGDPDYCYSACLLAYIHLSNALYDADRDAWADIRSGLSDAVLCDLRYKREYWSAFETPVQKASNTVYEGFLHSYDQTLGLRSYGACVDLLVNYYYAAAERYLGEEG